MGTSGSNLVIIFHTKTIYLKFSAHNTQSDDCTSQVELAKRRLMTEEAAKPSTDI